MFRAMRGNSVRERELVLGLSGRKGLQLRAGVCLDTLLLAEQDQVQGYSMRFCFQMTVLLELHDLGQMMTLLRDSSPVLRNGENKPEATALQSRQLLSSLPLRQRERPGRP